MMARLGAVLFACLATIAVAVAQPADPLSFWNDGASKKAIADFVARVKTRGGTDFVPPAERVAAFDNDGTLWCEHPVYVRLAFSFDRCSRSSAAARRHRNDPMQMNSMTRLKGNTQKRGRYDNV